MQLVAILVFSAVSRRALLQSVPTAAAAATFAAAPTSAALSPQRPPAVTALTAAAPPSAGVEFWSGLLAGAVQKTAKELLLHPLDTAKARLQFSSRRRALGELFEAPYAGLAPALISGAPAASAFFAVKDATKRGVEGLQLGKSETTLLAVLCANVAYWGIKNPSEVLKVRRQAGVAGETLEAASTLWRAEGLGGFYSSAGPNYAYSTPVDVTKFLLYEQLKTQVRRRPRATPRLRRGPSSVPVPSSSSTPHSARRTSVPRQIKAGRNGASLSPLEAAVGGAISASTAQAIATPLDVARVRIMTADGAPSGGVVGTVRTIVAEEGVSALYTGVAPKVARALCSGAIQFSTYEATKRWAVGFLTRNYPGL